MDRKLASDIKAQLAERKVPPSLRSKVLGDILGIESEREQGRFTASETGAKRRAQEKGGIRQVKELSKAAQSTKSFEDYIERGGN